MSRQSSLVEDRIDDSDEDEFQEERSGRCRGTCSTRSDPRGRSNTSIAPDESDSTDSINRTKLAAAFQQSDLLKDVIAMRLFKTSVEKAHSFRRALSEDGQAIANTNDSSGSQTPRAGSRKFNSDMKGPVAGRSISRSLTSAEICDAQRHEMPKDKQGKRSRLIKSCIAQ